MKNPLTLTAVWAAMILTATLLIADQQQSAKSAKDSELPIASGPFQPTVDSLKQYKCPEWFRDAKLGIWAHWGPQGAPGADAWYARNMYIEGSDTYKHHVATYGHPSKFGFKDIIPLWTASKWEPDNLMQLYKKAGAKYFCAIAVHHDNFDCWDSKYNPWNAVNKGPKRDIVGEWKKSADKYGLRFGVTEHLGVSWNWFHTAKFADKTGPLKGVPYDGADPKFFDYYYPDNQNASMDYTYKGTPEWVEQGWYNRIRDVVDKYHPDLLYSDGGLPYDGYGRRLLAHFYNSNRERHNGALEAVYNCKNINVGSFNEGTCVEDLERGVMQHINSLPWQTDTCVGDWFYVKGVKYKSSKTVICMLADIVSKNGNLLLNFPQHPDGTMDQECLDILQEMADWMTVNEEAIFKTRPWLIYGEGKPSKSKGGPFNEDAQKYTAKDVRFTTKDGSLYAILLGWPEDGQVVIRSLAEPAGEIEQLRLLGHDGEIRWSQTSTGLEVSLPAEKPCKHVYVLKIKGDNLKPAPLPAPDTAVSPTANGSFVLEPDTATLHGKQIRVEGGENSEYLAAWDNAGEWASWELRFPGKGTYSIEVVYSAAYADTDFVLELGKQKFIGTANKTPGWYDYQTLKLGSVAIDQAAKFTLDLRAQNPAKWKAMNVRSIKVIKQD